MQQSIGPAAVSATKSTVTPRTNDRTVGVGIHEIGEQRAKGGRGETEAEARGAESNNQLRGMLR
jgi:hypothetical protein